jgi:hypothetical protein
MINMDGLLGTFATVLFWSAFFVVFVFGFLLLLMKVVSNREWKAEYNGNIIRVENTWVRETLYINAAIQDENIGLLASRSKLWGKLPTGEEVKVSIGSTLNFHCNIFVDQKLVFKK